MIFIVNRMMPGGRRFQKFHRRQEIVYEWFDSYMLGTPPQVKPKVTKYSASFFFQKSHLDSLNVRSLWGLIYQN